MGEFWLGEVAKCVILRDFNGIVGAEALRFSGSQFGLVVQTLDGAGLIHRAGRLTRPHGKLTLTISAAHWIQNRLLGVLKALHIAA